MITIKKEIPNVYGGFIREYIGLSTDTKPMYRQANPTKAEFEAHETNYFTESGGSYTRCSDGDPYKTITARLRTFLSGTLTAVSVTAATFLGQETEVGEYIYTFKEDAATPTVTAQTDSTLTTADVAVAKATMFKKIKTAGNHDFIYDGTDWKYGETAVTLSTYGITISNSPTLVTDDKIRVTITGKWYDAEDTEITLATYGISVTGNASDNDAIDVEIYGTDKTFYKAEKLNGSTFKCIDNSKLYMFDESTPAWTEQT
jgi:hypothetical protein